MPQIATFAAGCFWGVEELFRVQKGVINTEVGYMGGHTDNPTYEDVCGNRTGHAEAVQVTYDPSQVSYEKLLKIFWENHDPTTSNRQGPDIGSQYRSVIFFHTSEQENSARKAKEGLQQSPRYADKNIVTEIISAGKFWRAEEYHQQYFLKNGGGTCHI
ncbi:MAG: peptide-methionine (S)-S-oxide reductase MsrA [Patescibacteria group bacterium]|nr:peptide-methionine (S)-S-oxide reductase MsrA [Patescibacteria group bacterium]